MLSFWNVRYGITIRIILTLFVDQSMGNLEKTNFLIQMQIKKCIYLMKQLRIFYITLYHTRQSFVIAVPHASIAKVKVWLPKKIFLRIAISKITVIFNYFEDSKVFSLSQLDNQNLKIFILESLFFYSHLIDLTTSPKGY